MRACRDTFLHFLADNLTGQTVHPLRRDVDNPSSGTLQNNAVNVQFIKDHPDVHIGSTFVIIDVINDNELQAIANTRDVWNLLSAAAYTPKFDYSSGSPVATGTNVMWDPCRVTFIQVRDDFSFHYSCLLELEHRFI